MQGKKQIVSYKKFGERITIWKEGSSRNVEKETGVRVSRIKVDYICEIVRKAISTYKYINNLSKWVFLSY